MLVVRVELHSTITRKVTELCKLKIYNDETGTQEQGNYVGEFSGDGVDKTVRVYGLTRLRLRAWHVIKAVLEAGLTVDTLRTTEETLKIFKEARLQATCDEIREVAEARDRERERIAQKKTKRK